ncbi:neprilysin-2 [Tribolium castaneum]|uniref:Membrane metallo-endopeptidase-like 1 n=1 Tax=Tribolium castaneum TaxID=7070 RepID=D6WNX9_TRICA|nr:PREDICTED: membrane metallo-endopeptidase-like 1 [Tribolium castaneum]EFA04402.1 Membrane metallo-endopeptidase-like 1 [Tribolium castaneum]|eukprot:XP_008194350.1 PREDICTED: membrane metallo-endopeptidase-like 1 [Tribolium castaneum]
MPLRQDSWWKRKTKLERKLIVVAFGSLLLASFLSVSLICHTIHSTFLGSDDICLTRECVQTAGEVFRNMDESVNPCDDFYRFACGNYIKHSLISNDKTFANTFTVINDLLQEQIKIALEEKSCRREPKPFQTVKKYYRACKNKSLAEKYGLDIAKKLLSDIGGWPVLSDDWEDFSFDWISNLKALRDTGLSVNCFLDVSVGLDFKRSTRRLIQIDQPGLGLSREYLVKGINDKIVKAYYEYMVDIAQMFGAERKKARQELLETLKFEIRLANFSLSQEDRRNISSLYNLLTIQELENKYKNIPWLDLINIIMPTSVQVNRSQPVLVGVPYFLGAFEKLICETPKRVQANYIMWRVVKDLISYLNQEVRDRELIFKHAINGIQESPPRWKECIDETTSLLPIVIGAMYVRKYFHVDAKTNALEMVKYIKEQFKDLLRSIEWMDAETRKSALDKANTIVDHIAYPDELLDDGKISQLYDGLEVDETQFLYSALNISKFAMDYTMSRLIEPVNKTDWREHGFPAQVNAFYHPLENSITFPAGILQGVFFHKDRPRYMNFGAVGSVIGHEITHGFDDTGRQFDKNGNLVNWWKEETKTKFLEKAQCIIKQYNNYTVPEVKMKLNGVRTQGENIADNGGVKQAYLAYKKWQRSNPPEPKLPGLKYEPRQLFWVSAAQIWCSKHRPEAIALQVTVDAHSPAEFRVLGPFSNSEFFAKDFHCPKGSKMNPEHKCSVW